jgi:peptidoglycan/LPS O-acetylase OafA/YrhL
MICVAIYNRDLRGLNTRILKFMGRVSYSLYLLHATVLFVMLHCFYGLLPKTIIFALYIGGSFLLAAISYKLIERPSMELGRRLLKERSTLSKERNVLVSVP